MKLTVFNGSPRGEKSNSTRIIHWVFEGLGLQDNHEIHYLRKETQHKTCLDRAKEADTLLFVLPLYVDSMPGICKAFFEMLEENKPDLKGKTVYFIIHSGFPEMVQSRSLEEYLEYFSTEIMNWQYKGTVIIGGSEAMQMAPDGAFSRLKAELKSVAEAINIKAPLPENLNRKINKRERMTALQRLLFLINPFKNFYWHYRAGKHKEKIILTAKPY